MVEGGYEKGIKRKMDTDETDSKKTQQAFPGNGARKLVGGS